MSEFCDFVPDDISCQTPDPDIDDGGDDGHMHDGDKKEEEYEGSDAEMRGLLAQIDMLFIALF